MSYKKKKIIGMLIFCIGTGVLLAVTMPLIGWIIISAIALIYVGYYLYKN